MKYAVLAILWAATAAAGWLLGKGSAHEAPAPGGAGPAAPVAVAGPDDGGQEEIERLRGEIRRLKTEADAPPGGTTTGRTEMSAAAETPPSPAAIAAAQPGAALPSFADATVEEASRVMMSWAEARLEEGPQGYLAILSALDGIQENEDFRRLFQSEEVAARVAYPWVRFLVDHEDDLLALSEWIFQTLAEKPATFGQLDDDALEPFTEGVGFLLPGAVPPEKLAQFRTLAEKFLAIPESELPGDLKSVRSDLKRLLDRWWAEPLAPDQALALLKAGKLGLDSHRAQQAMRQMTPAQIAELDLVGLLGPMIEKGDYQALQILRALPAGSVASSLDATFIAAVDAGKMHGGMTWQYLSATGRTKWPASRDVLERMLTGGEQARAGGFQALLHLSGNEADRPDKQWVADALVRYECDTGYASMLKSRYGIE